MRFSRRRFLLRSGGALATAGASTALLPTKAFAGENDSVYRPASSVQKSAPGQVEVAGHAGAIPTDGFPADWVVHVGDRVALWAPSGRVSELHALPMVTSGEMAIQPASLRRGDFFAGDRTLRLDPAAVIRGDTRRIHDTVVATYWTVDRERTDGPDRIIAVQW